MASELPTSNQKLYAERDHYQLSPQYERHLLAMTAEGLYSKSAIAAELAYRDIEIERLRPMAESWESYEAAQERKAEMQPVETTPVMPWPDVAELEFYRAIHRQRKDDLCAWENQHENVRNAWLANTSAKIRAEEPSLPIASSEGTIGYPPCFFCGRSIEDHRSIRTGHPWREGPHVTDHDLEKARLYFAVKASERRERNHERYADLGVLPTEQPEMAMLPNDHHPGPRCSCRECLDRYPSENGTRDV